MKKQLLLLVVVLLTSAVSYAQVCQNYSFYLSNNHVDGQGNRSCEIYSVALDEGTSTATLTELYTLDKTVHLGFDAETQLLYAVNSFNGEISAFDVSIVGPEIAIGALPFEFGYVQVVYDGAGALVVANEITNEIFSYDIATDVSTHIGTGPVHGGDMVFTASGDMQMYTREGGGTILDMDNGQAVIGSIPNWTTGAALMNNGQILASVRFENEFVVRNADGSDGGTYAAILNGAPFELANGDLTGGCNDPDQNVELTVSCDDGPSPAYQGEEEVLNIPASSCVGHNYGFWSSNLTDAYTPNNHWTMSDASFEENLDGTAVFSGLFTNNAENTLQFEYEVILSGRTVTPPAGSPKEGDCFGDVDNSDWYYYPVTNGVFTGINGLEGAIVNVTRMGESFQVGTGANMKQEDVFGASGWLSFEVVSQPDAGPGFHPVPNHGDFNIGLAGQPNVLEVPSPCAEICVGESASLVVEGYFGTEPYEYEWSTGESGPSITVSPLVTTVYNVTVTDGVGSEAAASVEVIVHENPTLETSSTNILCANDVNGTGLAFAQGGTEPYTYSWGPLTGNQVGANASGLGEGVYEVTVTDDNGCSATDVIVLGIEDSTPPEAICSYEDGVVYFSGTDNCEVVEATAYVQLSCGDQIIVTDGQPVILECVPLEEGGYSEDGLYMFALAGKDKKYLWRYESNEDDWSSMADAPDKIKEGGSLVYDGGDFLYAVRGHKKKDFWRYDILNNTWSDMSDAPDKIGHGGALVYDGGDNIYALKGDKKKDFWRYSISGNSWSDMHDAPSNVKGGAALAHDGGDYIYAFKGDKKKDFWRYSISNDNWSDMHDAPSNVKDGGALTHDGGNYIYAFKGDKKKDFWRYDIANDSWSDMQDAPGDVKYGGALTHDGGNFIYATKGDDKKDFWTYDIANDSWSDNSDAPDKVKEGGALAYVGQVTLPVVPEECEYAYNEEGVLVIAHGSATLVVTVTDSNGLVSTCETEIECYEPPVPCGECDGQLTQLTLEFLGDEADATIKIYEGSVNPDKLFETFIGINNGDEMSFVGSKNDNKMGAKIFLTINDGPGLEIHTSCSVDIYTGQIWGDYLIVSGISHEGGPLCPGDTPPDGECGECDGQLTQLSLEFLGDEADATIKIYEGSVNPDKLFETFNGVNTGDTMSFIGSKNDNKMGAKIFLTINDGPGLEIHTSCSVDIFAGQIWGDYLIISGISHNGGPLCPGDNPPGDPEGECEECDGGLTSLDLEVQGSHDNVTIRIYNDHVEPNKLFKTFNNVSTGDILSFVGTKDHGKFGAKIYLTVDGGPGFEIHTSCSVDIYVGQVWGDYLILAGISRHGGPLCPGDTPPGDPEGECEECDGGLTSLDLEVQGSHDNVTIRIYNDHVEPNKLFKTFNNVSTGDILSFVGTKDHGKFGAKIYLTVDGGPGFEIHTSCSVDIYVGQVWGDYLILAGTSRHGGPLCPGDTPPGGDDCGECDGQLTQLSLEFLGDEADATIKIYEGSVSPNKLFETFNDVNTGDIMSFVGSKNDNKMGAKIFLTINDGPGLEIHTSCSVDIFAGQTWGDYLIVSGVSHNGGPLCSVFIPLLVSNSDIEGIDSDLDDDLLSGNLKSQPNPSTGNVVISYTSIATERTQIDIYNTAGQLVRSVYSGIIEEGLTYSTFVDLNNLDNGVYLIRVSSENAVEMERLIIAR